MEVRIKYQLLSKATISSISYNSVYGVLGLAADGNDTATFFSPSGTNDLRLSPRLSAESRPPSSGCISWSPNGKLVAVANTKVQLWVFDGVKMAPLRVINQGYIQIKNIVWSQDSRHYLCYGLTPKDTPLAINIRNVQTNELRQIQTSDIAVLANFDPFGKYIMVLLMKNCLDLYDAHTLQKIKSINLAETKNDIPTLRDRRLGDWSPDYSYFVCPNLNDSRLPTVLLFDRNKNFAIKDILIGHQTTISSAKFNPNVYEYESDTTFILAIGDSSGCLSLWRIGKTKSYKQPLFIMSSPAKAQESIEGIEWNSDGSLLFINVLKKYVVVAGFKETDFGNKLSEADKTSLIVATYGASGANQIAGARFQVFGQNQFSFKNENQIAQTTKPVTQNAFSQQKKQKTQQKLVKTSQQTMYYKDANNRQRKKINPSRIVPQSQAVTQPTIPPPSIPGVSNTNSLPNILQKQKMPTIKIPVLKQQIKRQYYLPNEQVLEIQRSKDVYILSLRSKSQHEEGKNKRFFEGELNLLQITRSHILIINNNKLFIFDFDLKAIQLPCYLGEVCNFAVNNEGAIFYMTSNGVIKGFNFITHELIFESSAAYLFLAEEPGQINANPFSMFTVFDSDSQRLHVQLKKDLSRYFYCKKSSSWVQFNFDEGFYMPGHSLRISKLQTQNAQNFYSNLINPVIKSSQSAKGQTTVNQYQLQLLYYGKYAKDNQKYKDALLRMLADLKSKGKSMELRRQIRRYFIDKTSQSYIKDAQLWNKVKKLGGKVIQQFLILGLE